MKLNYNTKVNLALIGLGVLAIIVWKARKRHLERLLDEENSSASGGRTLTRTSATQRRCCKSPTGETYYVTQSAGSTSFPCADGHSLC